MSGDFLYQNITKQIIGGAFYVWNELRYGYNEFVYQRALAKRFDAIKLRYEKEVSLEFSFEGAQLGYGRVDFIVADCVLVELKVGRYINRNHTYQVLNYLNSSEYKLGLILLFSSDGVKIRRVIHESAKTLYQI